MDDMATLAERLEVAPVIIARVMIKMRSRQKYARQQGGAAQLLRTWPHAQQAPAIVPPSTGLLAPPAPIAEVLYGFAMRPAALLAATFGTVKANNIGQLRPVDRVKEAMLAADGH
jgi:hypothetical protein